MQLIKIFLLLLLTSISSQSTKWKQREEKIVNGESGIKTESFIIYARHMQVVGAYCVSIRIYLLMYKTAIFIKKIWNSEQENK